MRSVVVLGVAAFVVSCSAPAATNPSPVPTVVASASAASEATSPTAADGLEQKPVGTGRVGRHWYTVPDGLDAQRAAVAVDFSADAAPGHPRARLRSSGETVPLTFIVAPTAGPEWSASLSLGGVAPGQQTVEFLVRMRDGSDAVAATATFMLSFPEYLVWTLDFEGDAASNEALDNTYLINRTYFVPMTLMWNPRVWTTTQVSAERADVMQKWTTTIAERGQGEIALHLHAWTDFVRAAGVTPRTAPNWSGRSDGYDVPLTAFDEPETRKLIDHALSLMSDHGMPRPTSFRGGGLFANAANLRAVAAAGFRVDTSGTNAGVFGRLPLPWTLAKDAQPYRPSASDANATGDLPLLEVPNIAGNTFGLNVVTIRSTIRDDLAMLAPAGQAAAEPRTLTLVSHPATIDSIERDAIESLFAAFEPYRYDRDVGPLRFVTLAQLAQALK